MSEKEPKVGIVLDSGRSSIDLIQKLGGKQVSPVPIEHPIAKPPVLSFPHGRAWLCDLAEGVRQKGFDPGDDGTLAHWVIEAPGYHPAWHSYSIVLLHLRPLARPKKTLLYTPYVTHEIWVYAMNPDADRNQLVGNGLVEGHWLMPMNYAGQFVEVSDELAKERVRKTVQGICEGELSPDTDYRAVWHDLYGDHMFKDRPGGRIVPIERWT